MTDSAESVSFIEPRRLRELVAEGEDLHIVDVRTPEEYEAGHIEGAINIPSERLAEVTRELPRRATIVTVCNLGRARSCNAAEQLKGLGYVNVSPLRGGTQGWLSSREPGEAGATPRPQK